MLFSCSENNKPLTIDGVVYDTVQVIGEPDRIDVLFKGGRNRYKGFYTQKVKKWEARYELYDSMLCGSIVYYNKNGDTNRIVEYKGMIMDGVQKTYSENQLYILDSLSNNEKVYTRVYNKKGQIDSLQATILFLPELDIRGDTMVLNRDTFEVLKGNSIDGRNLNLSVVVEGYTIINKEKNNQNAVTLTVDDFPLGEYRSEFMLTEKIYLKKGTYSKKGRNYKEYSHYFDFYIINSGNAIN